MAECPKCEGRPLVVVDADGRQVAAGLDRPAALAMIAGKEGWSLKRQR